MPKVTLNASKKTKSTPAGEIPVDWACARIDDLCVIKSGVGFPLSQQGQEKGDYPFIKVSDFSLPKNGREIREANHWISRDVSELLGASLLPAGSIVFAKVGAALLLNRRRILTRLTCLDNNLMALIPKQIDVGFLFQLSLTIDLGRYAQDGALPSINGSDVGSISIPVPPVPEQKRIATILATWDEALENLDALIEAKERRRKALMQRLLTGKRRVKGFTGKWPGVQLSEVAENVADQNKGRMGTESLYGVTKADGVVPMREHVKGESFARCKRLEHNWFAYNPMRINIGSIARWQGAETVMVSGDYVVFRCNEERLLPAYLDQLRRSWLWESFVTKSGNGSVRIRIYFSDLGELRFRCPPVEEQAAIVAILETCDDEIRLLRQQRAAINRQKRGLMQRLLTGKLRVKP